MSAWQNCSLWRALKINGEKRKILKLLSTQSWHSFRVISRGFPCLQKRNQYDKLASHSLYLQFWSPIPQHFISEGTFNHKNCSETICVWTAEWALAHTSQNFCSPFGLYIWKEEIYKCQLEFYCWGLNFFSSFPGGQLTWLLLLLFWLGWYK